LVIIPNSVGFAFLKVEAKSSEGPDRAASCETRVSPVDPNEDEA
jgi:hypothetical protein